MQEGLMGGTLWDRSWAELLTTQEAGRVQVLKGGAGDDIFLFTWSLLQREWQDLCFLSPHIKA